MCTRHVLSTVVLARQAPPLQKSAHLLNGHDLHRKMGASANTRSTPAIHPLSTEELEWLNARMRALVQVRASYVRCTPIPYGVQETRANKAAAPERAFNACPAKDTGQ